MTILNHKKLSTTNILRQIGDGLEATRIELEKLELSNSKLTQYSRKSDEIKAQLHKLSDLSTMVGQRIDKQILYERLFTNISFVFVIYLLITNGPHLGKSITMNYYIVVAQIIPILLVALYFSQPTNKLKKPIGALSELIGSILPAFVGIAAALTALATNQSRDITFFLTLYALATICLEFVSTLIIPAFAKGRNLIS